MDLAKIVFIGSVSLLLALVPVCPQAFAQPRQDSSRVSDIRGIVVDSASGEAIIGANIVLGGTRRGANTNTSGFYILSAVPAGGYDLTASAVGYARRRLRVTVGGGEPVIMNIRLAPQPVQLGEMVVRSERMSPLWRGSASVHVVTPRELQRVPAAGQQDLLRSLQMLPGITSTSDVSAKFYVRGGAGDQNLIYLDGMKLYNPYHAFGLFSVLDPDLVKSAEVYTGAFPAGLGGRLSSVVNVTTRDGNRSRLAGIANLNFLSGKVELDGPISGDNTWLVSGRTSLFQNSIERMIPNPSPTSFYDIFFKGTVGTSTGRFGFRGYASGDDVQPIAPEQPNHSWRNSALSAVYSSLISDRMYLDASVSYSQAEIKRVPKQEVSVTPASSRLEEVNLHSEITTYLEDQDAIIEGFEFNFPSIDDSLYVNNTFPRRIADTGLELYLWVRYDGHVGPFGYDVGLHSDLPLLLNGGLLEQGVQPRITLSYVLGGSWTAKASYGVYTQNLITISNEDDLISLFDAWLYLPDNLRPEEAVHYVAGAEGNIFPWLATSVQAYSKSYRSLALYNPNKVLPDDPDYLSGTGLAYGVETLLRYSSTFLDLYATYAWSKVTLTTAGFSYAPRYDRRHTGKAIATLHLTEGFDATVRWEYGSGYPYTQGAGFYSQYSLSDIDVSPFPGGTLTPMRTLGAKNAERLPAYHRLDMGFNCMMTLGMFRGTLGVSVMNVYDAKNILYYDRETGRTDYMVPFFPTASLTLEF